MMTLLTHKLRSAKQLARSLPGGTKKEYPDDETHREMLYDFLAEIGYTWDVKQQTWRKRQDGARGPAKRPIVKENSFVLVRIMARREILDSDRENFALAFEAIGYDIVEFSQPVENHENGYSRVYLKARVK